MYALIKQVINIARSNCDKSSILYHLNPPLSNFFKRNRRNSTGNRAKHRVKKTKNRHLLITERSDLRVTTTKLQYMQNMAEYVI